MFKKIRGKVKSAKLAVKLRLARQQLISDLETRGMEFLVMKMASSNDYSDLIAEKRKFDLTFSSDDSESWFAFQRSDKLHSQQDKESLFDLLKDEKYAGFKKYIYCCLASICANTNDKNLFNFLVEQVHEENDESMRVSILTRLANVEKSSGYDMEPVKTLVKDGTSSESLAAIKALSNTNYSEVEDLLLDEFKTASTHLKAIICGPLSTVGTKKSIPFLQKAHQNTGDSALKLAIENAIITIGTRAGN